MTGNYPWDALEFSHSSNSSRHFCESLSSGALKLERLKRINEGRAAPVIALI